MRPSILNGIVAFLLWCVTDTSVNSDHARDSDGRITYCGVLSIALVQIVLWALVGLFTDWIIPHLPLFLLTEWRAKEHWKEHRPKTYAELQKAGTPD